MPFAILKSASKITFRKKDMAIFWTRRISNKIKGKKNSKGGIDKFFSSNFCSILFLKFGIVTQCPTRISRRLSFMNGGSKKVGVMQFLSDM